LRWEKRVNDKKKSALVTTLTVFFLLTVYARAEDYRRVESLEALRAEAERYAGGKISVGAELHYLGKVAADLAAREILTPAEKSRGRAGSFQVLYDSGIDGQKIKAFLLIPENCGGRFAEQGAPFAPVRLQLKGVLLRLAETGGENVPLIAVDEVTVEPSEFPK